MIIYIYTCTCRYHMFRSQRMQTILNILEYLPQMKGKLACLYANHYCCIYGTSLRLIVGQEVTVEINSARRCTNARIHSAGHLLDSAFINLGVTDLVPSKV